jgi:tetraacyldisaccharide 4'-kinase
VIDPRTTDHVWYEDDLSARVARALLWPFALGYAGVVAVRGALYDAGLLESVRLALPSVSVGNLTVGGTGKTPAAAWLAARLVERGARPAIVMRGYGSDEPLVHREVNPEIPVVIAGDRVAGVKRARALGADVAVLDDAFQHRRARRNADVVLISADRWRLPARPLPAGPWRESLGALSRATMVVVTRRAVSSDAVAAVIGELGRLKPSLPVAAASLSLGELHRVGATETRPLVSLEGERVYLVAGIGDPLTLVSQLEAAGAVVTLHAFEDHHRFTDDDVSAVQRHAARASIVVCTLKDAVKLAPLWPRAAPSLWYVSQQFALESGEGTVDSLLASLLAARHDQPGVRPLASGHPSLPNT